MSVSEDFGELIYVSRLKVERMHATLKLPLWKRLSALDVRGPCGAGVGIGLDTHRDDLVANLRLLTDVMYAKYPVRHYYDPALRQGEWFVGRVRDMAYGWGTWDDCREDGPVTFFTGRDDERQTELVLGGSLQHMLDRDLPDLGARTGSTTERFREVMAKIIAVEEQGREPGSVPPVRSARAGSQDLEDVARASSTCIDGFLADNGGRTPLIFMARATEIFEPKQGQSPRRLITGTPLYVGIWQQHERSAVDAETKDKGSMLARFRAGWSGGQPEPVRAPQALPAPAVSDPAAHDRGPSLDVALYARPSSAASYSSPSDYYDASPRVQRGRCDVAVGDDDFWSRDRHWCDEQGGGWHVSFSTYGSPLLARGPDNRGDVVATSVGPEGTHEVLVLIADVRFGDVERSLAGCNQAEPRLKWVVDHLPHHAAPSRQAEQ